MAISSCCHRSDNGSDNRRSEDRRYWRSSIFVSPWDEAQIEGEAARSPRQHDGSNLSREPIGFVEIYEVSAALECHEPGVRQPARQLAHSDRPCSTIEPPADDEDRHGEPTLRRETVLTQTCREECA